MVDELLLTPEEIKEIQKTNYARGAIGFTEGQIELMVAREGIYKEEKIAKAQLAKVLKKIKDGELDIAQLDDV